MLPEGTKVFTTKDLKWLLYEDYIMLAGTVVTIVKGFQFLDGIGYSFDYCDEMRPKISGLLLPEDAIAPFTPLGEVLYKD